MNQTDILIVGAGPAGMSAAIYARRAGYEVVLLEAAMAGGQMVNTPEVENYPAIAHIAGWELTQNLLSQIKDLGAKVVTDTVTGITPTESGFTVQGKREQYSARAVILANGAKRRTLGIEGEDTFRGRGVSYCATCDGAFFRGKEVAVIGGGNTALEDALYLAGICSHVHLIHRRDSFRGQRLLAERVLANPNIEVHYETVPVRIEGDERVCSLIVQSKGGERTTLSLSAVFVAIGLVPDNACFAPLIALDEQGYVLAGEDCKTNVPGIFVAGDTRKKELRQIVTAAADGAIAATAAASYLGE